jgi:hypothetical protein
MENFDKKYEEYKKKFYDDMEKDKDKEDKDKIKEEIYNLIYKSIGYLDIDGIITDARKDAIDYKDINYETLYNRLSTYDKIMHGLNNKIIKIQKIEIIKKDNVMALSSKHINFISLFANRENIKKFNKLFEFEKIDDNFYLLNRINKIDINKIEFDENINNGYNLEILEAIENKKINRIYFLLHYFITQLQKENITNQLIDDYIFYNKNYNNIKNKINNLDRNHSIACEEIESIIKKNIIIIGKYLQQDEIITEEYLKNKRFLYELQCKFIIKNNIFTVINNYDIRRLRIFKNYLINNLLVIL